MSPGFLGVIFFFQRRILAFFGLREHDNEADAYEKGCTEKCTEAGREEKSANERSNNHRDRANRSENTVDSSCFFFVSVSDDFSCIKCSNE